MLGPLDQAFGSRVIKHTTGAPRGLVRHCYLFKKKLRNLKAPKTLFSFFDFEESKNSVNGRRSLNLDITVSLNSFSYNFFFIGGLCKIQSQFAET
jgi:hypothetical protein